MGESKLTVKEQILHILKMQGVQTATALAEQLRVSPMAVRQHLQQLKADRWVLYEEKRQSLGRPVKLWSLTAEAMKHFPDSHTDLMVDLLQGVRTLFGDEGLTRLVVDRSWRQTQIYRSAMAEQAPQGDWQEQVRAIAQLRSQEGYMAEVLDSTEGELLLVENHCPICVAAQTCPQLCSAELEVFRAVLGEAVQVDRVEHLLGGDRRCAYRIRAI
jgi:predicted ArsR family transcriptional regulator